MIFYLDTYITDEPLHPAFVWPNREIRNSCPQYKMPRRIDITKYTLASYKMIPWTHVVIAYDVADKDDESTFLDFVQEVFPDADVSRPRSSNQKTYRARVEQVCSFEDDFIFYAPNNDHPLIASNLNHLPKLLKKASRFSQNYPFVSVVYSHFSEFVNAPVVGSPFYRQFSSDSRIVEDDEIATSFVRFNGDNSSIQIVNRNLLQHWFCSHDLGDARIIRAEDVRRFLPTPNQLMIVPKKELCAHFDGYSHTTGITKISPDQIPPLFIPTGFFDSSIRIAYGYPEYRDGWVNINPSARDFSFRDRKTGTDLKIGLQDIPLFWKSRIAEIDINVNADLERIKEGREKYFETVRNPWRKA